MNSFNDFQLFFNSQVHQINFQLFCCLSDKFFRMNKNEKEFHAIVPEDDLRSLISFLEIFQGEPFNYTNFEFGTIYFLIESFELTSFRHYISTNLPFPNSLSESIQFFCENHCEFFNLQYNHCLEIIISNFEKISLDEFDRLSNSHLSKIFSSPCTLR